MFDNAVPVEWRRDLFDLIRCPSVSTDPAYADGMARATTLLSARLAAYGITTADLDPIVEDTLADAVMANTPRPPEASDVRTILEAVL